MWATAFVATVELLLAIESPAAANAQGMDFAFERGPGAERCPDRTALAARVARHVHRQTASHGQVSERVAVSIERTDEGYVATVTTLGSESGMRRIIDKGADCAGLGEALALTLAMIADGELVAEVAPQVPPAIPAVRPWQLGAAALGSTGMLGASSLGIAVNAVWQPWPRLTTSLTAFWLPSRSIAVEQSSVEVTLVASLAHVCFGPLPYGGRVYPALCGQLGAGALHGAGEQLENQRSVWRPWLAAGASVSVGVRILPRWTLSTSAGRLFSLKDESFVVGGRGQIYDSGHPGWLGQLGLLWRIP